MITHVALVTLYVSNQDEAMDFFVDKLGFHIHTDAQMGPGMRWIEVALPEERTHVVLAKADTFDIKAGDIGPAFNLACDDLAATHRTLIEKGAEAGDIVIEPWGAYFTVTGPDGYRILIAEIS